MASLTRVSLLCALLAACQTPAGSFCDIARPIRLSAETIATMSDAEVKDALAHNRKGAALCGWRP